MLASLSPGQLHSSSERQTWEPRQSAELTRSMILPRPGCSGRAQAPWAWWKKFIPETHSRRLVVSHPSPEKSERVGHPHLIGGLRVEHPAAHLHLIENCYKARDAFVSDNLS